MSKVLWYWWIIIHITVSIVNPYLAVVMFDEGEVYGVMLFSVTSTASWIMTYRTYLYAKGKL